MKKVRIALASLALFLAVGGAFASQFLTQTYYELQISGIETDCLPRHVDFTCSVDGEMPCEITVGQKSVILREHGNPDFSCGLELSRVGIN